MAKVSAIRITNSEHPFQNIKEFISFLNLPMNDEYITYISFCAAVRNFRGNSEASKQTHHGWQVHHICPRVCGGNNTKANLVMMTDAEHKYAHYLFKRCLEVWYSHVKSTKLRLPLELVTNMKLKHNNGVLTLERILTLCLSSKEIELPLTNFSLLDDLESI